jgi:hypothetical protein
MIAGRGWRQSGSAGYDGDARIAGSIGGVMFGIRSHKRPTTDSAAAAPEVYPASEGADDRALHLDGETCARCGRTFRPTDEARRTAKGDCVHLAC